jgi:uncharacterized protein (DUF952 family)
MHPDLAYKILPAADWAAAQGAGVFLGSPVDLADGFIHLSSAAQTRATAAKWFAGVEGLVLLEVDLTLLGDKARWEPSRDGDLFPHVHGILPVQAVRRSWPMPLDASGAHRFPDVIA